MRIAIGSDHGGFELKQQLLPVLSELGHIPVDCGPREKITTDYPRMAFAVAQRVATGDCERGIVIDGAGIGSAMAANKVLGVRAAACYNEALAKNAREHNDANVLSLGAGQTSFEEARRMIALFLSTDCTASRHQRRVRIIKDIERGHLKRHVVESGPIQEKSNMELSAADIEQIAQRVKELLAHGGAAADSNLPHIPPDKLAGMIDHTLLKPEASRADIDKLCEEADRMHFYSVCVNPANVRQARELLKNSPVVVCAVVGFPLGAASPDIKELEAGRAVREGATEIDMVINVGALKSHDYDLVLKDIRGVVEVCKQRGARCKVILETSLLTDEEKVKACELCMKAGADFVKTSTGFGSGGATVEDIRLMARTVAPRKLGVKASGGVRTYEDARKMIAAGATRIGASSSTRIIEEARAAAEGKPIPKAEAGGGY